LFCKNNITILELIRLKLILRGNINVSFHLVSDINSLKKEISLEHLSKDIYISNCGSIKSSIMPVQLEVKKHKLINLITVISCDKYITKRGIKSLKKILGDNVSCSIYPNGKPNKYNYIALSDKVYLSSKI
jgi:hypothetical protein